MARDAEEEPDRRDSRSPLLEGQNARYAAVTQQPSLFHVRKRFLFVAVMIFLLSILALYGLSGWTFAKPKVPYTKPPKTPLIVDLHGYGRFKGTQVLATWTAKTALQEPVDAWLGIDYAKQPVLEKRFAPPEWPESFEGIKDADSYGPICIQGFGGLTQSEACLNFNVYRTTAIPLRKKLPVFAFIHGGSFVGGHGRSFDGAAFVAQSVKPLVVVTFQYRLGALGSLPSKLFEEEGLLNLGLLDQRLMLEFLQEHISSFGGDPDSITLGGQSAGAHSVGVHLFHNYGEDRGRPLFSQAILASGSPVARAFPEATYPLYKRQFSRFMAYLHCPESPNEAALRCLRKAPVTKIQYISSTTYRDSEYNITWPWQPVSPGPLLEKRGSASGADGSFFKIPILISSTTDEGKLFAPHDLTTTTEFRNFMANVNLGLTQEDLDDLESLYPDPEDETSPYYDSPISTQYNRIAAAYGDYSYICPVQDTANLLATFRSRVRTPVVYKARFNTPNWAPDWQGIPHASDAAYFNGVPNVEFPEISTLYASYYASFIVSGDPNSYAIRDAPPWEEYDGVGGGELVVGSAEGIGTGMEHEGDDDTSGLQGIRVEACEWWRDPVRMERLRK
jgi:acetylcholinesterase